jgi:dipeptidase E
MILSSNLEYVEDYDYFTKAPDLKDDFTALSVIDFYPCSHHINAPFEKIISKYETELKLIPISNPKQ